MFHYLIVIIIISQAEMPLYKKNLPSSIRKALVSLSNYFYCTVIIYMIAMFVMESAINEIIVMVAVRN